MTEDLAETLAAAIAAARVEIDKALARIESGESSGAALVELRTHLVALLTVLSRDPGIDAASDDLYKTAEALAGEREPHERFRRQRMVKEAAKRFDARLGRIAPAGGAPEAG